MSLTTKHSKQVAQSLTFAKGINPAPQRPQLNRLRSSDPMSSLSSIDQCSNYSSFDNSKFIDKAFEQFKSQINLFNATCVYQTTFNPIKLPNSSFKNLKEALRSTLGFNQKVLMKVEEQARQLQLFKDKDASVRRIADLEEKIEKYEQIWEEFQLSCQEGKNAKGEELLEQLQSQLKFKSDEAQRAQRDMLSKIEIQAKICAEVLRENEALKAENINNKSLVAHTQAQLKHFLASYPSEQTQMEGTDEINLGDSRLNTENNNEIEQIVMLQSHRRLENIGSKQSDSPLTKALYLNDSGHQIELERLRQQVQDYSQNYLSKDLLVQIITKLQDTFSSLEIDASNLKDLLSHQVADPSQASQQQETTLHLEENMAVLHVQIQKALGTNLRSSFQQNEILDLKSEICTLKSKLLQADQRRIEEISAKNLTLSRLEQQINEEQRRRIEEMDQKEKVIEELERDIEHTIEDQMKENQELRDKNFLLETKLSRIADLEKEVRSMMGSNITLEIDLTHFIKKLLTESQNLKESLKSSEQTIDMLKQEHRSTSESEEQARVQQLQELEKQYQGIISELQSTLNQKLKAKDQEVHTLKVKMADQIDQISNTLDAHMSQNQDLNSNIEYLKEEIEGKEMKEKQLLTKIMRLREERSKLRQQQELLCQNLNDIFEYVSQIEEQLVVRDSQFRELFTIQRMNYDSKDELLHRVQTQKEQFKIVLQQLVEYNEVQASKGSRDQGVQAEMRVELKPQLQKQPDHYQEILNILRQQSLQNSEEKDKGELMLVLNAKLEDLKRVIERQGKIPAPNKPQRNHSLDNCKEVDLPMALKNATPKPKKSKSMIYSNNGKAPMQTKHTASTGDDDIIQSLLQDSQEGKEENGKFWFEMYQRVKSEITKERKLLAELQGSTQTKEEESYSMKQKLYLLKSENETLEKLNSQYLQQLQESKSKGLILQKQHDMRSQEIGEVIDYIIEELVQLSRSLKGEYMNGIIQRIDQTKQSENPIFSVAEELMQMLKTLFKQLQATQKEVSKMKKSMIPTRSPLRAKNDENQVNSQASTTYFRPQKVASSSQNRENVCQVVEQASTINKLSLNNPGRASFDYSVQPMTDRSNASRKSSGHTPTNRIPTQLNRKSSKNSLMSYKNQNPNNDSNSTQGSQINLPMSHAGQFPMFKFVPGQYLTERQRLELYELRTAAIREIDECETKGKQADPYLKKYVKSIDDLLKRATNSNL